MKALRTILASLAILISAVTVNAQRMSYEAMCDNARFLTDRMAYTLGISSPSLIDDIYRINFDYIYGINDYLDEVAYGYHYDEYMDICYQRDRALQYLLGSARWNRLLGYSYFYRPIVFSNYGWRFSIYDYDRYRTHWYFGAPSHYHVYHGGHYFHGMAPRVGHIDIRHGGNHPGFGNRPGGPAGRPNGGMNPGRPNGGMNPGRPNGGMNPGRPNGGMNNGRPNGGADRPSGNMNNGRPNGGADRPSGNMNNGGSMNRPEGNGTRPESMGSGRVPNSPSGNYSSGSATRSDNNNRSSSRPSNFGGGNSSRPASGFSNGGGNSRPAGGGHMGGGSRGGGHMGGGRR